jgi:hypothetical protein
MYKIWAYKRRTRKLRAKAGLPQLYDIDDLPDPAYDPAYVHVLDDKEQADLHGRAYFAYHPLKYSNLFCTRASKVPAEPNMVPSSWHRNSSRQSLATLLWAIYTEK